MSENPSTPDSASASTNDHAQGSRGDSPFPNRISWFLAEFAVVLSGVLVALALNAWWQAGQDRDQEQLYLEQLREDVRRSIDNIETQVQSERTSDRALTQLVRAFRMDPPPPRDSLLVWSLNAPNVAHPTPVIGTAQSLVTSGDLRLIREDSLRLALPTYVESIQNLHDSAILFRGQFVEGAQDMLGWVDYLGLIQQAIPPAMLDSVALSDPFFALPSGGVQRSITRHEGSPLESAPFYEVLSFMHTSQRNLTGLRTAMLDRHREIARLLEAAESE